MGKKAVAGPKKPGRKLVPEDPTLTDAERAAIKAVKEFEVAERTINLYKIDHSEVLQVYSELLDEREQKRQVADAAMRAADASFGPWQRFSEQKKYFPDKVFEHLGKAKFLALGGTINSQTVYALGGEKIEAAIASGEISKEVADEVRKITPKYRSPKDSGE